MKENIPTINLTSRSRPPVMGDVLHRTMYAPKEPEPRVIWSHVKRPKGEISAAMRLKPLQEAKKGL